MEEILHQLTGSLSYDLQGSMHPRWCSISSINSSWLENRQFQPRIFDESLEWWHFDWQVDKGKTAHYSDPFARLDL